MTRQKKKLLYFSSLVVILLLVSAFAGWLSPYDPDLQNYAIALDPPSISHPLGTDRYGRDMLSRVLLGSQVSIFSTLVLVAVTAAFGTAAGVFCGCAGKIADTVVMRIADVCLAFPGMVFALAVAAVLDGGIRNAVIALAVVNWPKYARIARSRTLSLKNEEYIAAARLSGDTDFQLVFRHILPNIGGQILVTAALDIGTIMMELAALSFLGLGAQPPTAEWGSMISEGRGMLQTCPWVVLAPGLGIFVTAALFQLLGDTLRDFLDAGKSW